MTKAKEESYVLRNPNFIELDNITELSFHQVNTKRVKMGEKGMLHREGGIFLSQFRLAGERGSHLATAVRQVYEES